MRLAFITEMHKPFGRPFSLYAIMKNETLLRGFKAKYSNCLILCPRWYQIWSSNVTFNFLSLSFLTTPMCRKHPLNFTRVSFVRVFWMVTWPCSKLIYQQGSSGFKFAYHKMQEKFNAQFTIHIIILSTSYTICQIRKKWLKILSTSRGIESTMLVI